MAIRIAAIGVVLLLALVGEFCYMMRFLRKAFVFYGVNVHLRGIKTVKIVISALTVACTVFVSTTLCIIILHFVLIAALIDLLATVLIKLTKRNGRFLIFLSASGIVPLILSAAVVLFGFYNMGNVKKTEYTVLTDKTLAQSYKVAFISDLHFETTLSEKQLKKVCDDISKQNPDIVILGGDIVDESTSKEGTKTAFSILGKIKAKYGVSYIFGNHDAQNYSKHKNYTQDELESLIKNCGIAVLKDESDLINGELCLIGRRDKSDKIRAEISSLIKDNGKFILVADHQPTQFQQNIDAGVDLSLSGHTHGGQIFPAGIIGELFRFNDATYGETKIGNYEAIVSSGIAGWGFPIRTEHHSEYMIVTLRSKK